MNNIMTDSLPRCAQCSSPVTDSIQIEIENHGRVKLGRRVDGSWICNDCATKRSDETTSTVQDDNNSNYHEHRMYLPILRQLMKPIYNLRKY
jgi:hypothetical protein